MKANCISILLFLTLFSWNLFGHEQVVHRAITANAAAVALGQSLAYSNFVNVVSPDIALKVATNFMVDGSFDEDYYDQLELGDVGGKRSYNHFYDPLDTVYGKGLSDAPPEIRSKIGLNSFTWSSTFNCVGWNWGGLFGLAENINTTNTWSWQNARYYEWLGLTATNTSQRGTNLDNMFRAIGQVMHLLEDASQPQHVRNEQHVNPWTNKVATALNPWVSPIEQYGLQNVYQLSYGDGSILNWRAAGFTKLEDFWDRHMYAPGSAAVLTYAESGGANTLGLAEWCNGNFLGARHLYPEYYPNGTNNIRYYPYPSRNHSTDYIQKSANLALGIRALTLKNNQQGQAIYVNKTGDGVTYDSISRFDYFGAKFPRFGMMTIRDDRVLSNYHNVFIPKAVKYSAGLLDYFFRGNLSVHFAGYTESPYDESPGQFQLQITNASSQTLQGGTFHLFGDNNGHRSEIPLTTDSFSTLATNASINAYFYPPSIGTSNLMVIYQGTVGVSGSTPADPVDQGIAIATKQLLNQPPDWTTLEWTNIGVTLIEQEGDETDTATFTLWNNGNLQFEQSFTSPHTTETVPINKPGDEFEVSLGYTDDDGANIKFGTTEGDAQAAELTYNGPGSDCNLHLSLSTTGEFPFLYINIFSGGNLLLAVQVFDENGEFDFPFAIPDTDGEVSTIKVELGAYISVDNSSSIVARAKITNF